MSSILVRNSAYLIRNPDSIERGCDLLVEGSQIQAIGPNLDAPANTQVLDGSGCAVMPGLINTHTHLYQNFMKGFAPGIPLVPWCNEVLFPTVGAILKAMNSSNDRAAYLWSTVSALEMIRGGVTCCVNMDANMHVTSPGIVRAWEDLGFRGVIAYTLANRWVPADLRIEEEEMKRKALEYIEAFHHPEGTTTFFLAPSTLFLCTRDLLRWVGDQTCRFDLGIQIHVSETAGEVDDILKESGCRPIEVLDQLGLLDCRLNAVHCCHVSSHEIELLARSGASVTHCPKSNMKLADGIAPVQAMREAGIPVSLATDGCASNDLLDMWEEMRAALLLARGAQNDASALTAKDVFAMATREAARTARVNAGQLEPGMLADLILVELKSPSLRPFHDEDLLNMLVFCAKASDVRDVIIHGRTILRDRQVVGVNEEELLAEAEDMEKTLFRMRQEYTPGSN